MHQIHHLSLQMFAQPTFEREKTEKTKTKEPSKMRKNRKKNSEKKYSFWPFTKIPALILMP